MNYNKKMFDQTIKIAGLGSVDFKEPIEYDDNLISYGEAYLEALLSETMLIMQCAGDPDEYYYMIAGHALYAGFCIANWEKEGQSKDESLKAVKALDAIAIMRINWKEIDTDSVDWFSSMIYDLAINDLQETFDQDFSIDNTNKYILGMLLAFFVIGYNLLPEYFE